MTANHTPEPWFTTKAPGTKQATVWADHGETLIADCSSKKTSVQGCRDNARLRAAAPELLQVAHDFQEVLEELGIFCECGEADCRTTRLRAAIAKASGTSATNPDDNECPDCRGTGEGQFEGQSCGACRGRGYFGRART